MIYPHGIVPLEKVKQATFLLFFHLFPKNNYSTPPTFLELKFALFTQTQKVSFFYSSKEFTAMINITFCYLGLSLLW